MTLALHSAQICTLCSRALGSNTCMPNRRRFCWCPTLASQEAVASSSKRLKKIADARRPGPMCESGAAFCNRDTGRRGKHLCTGAFSESPLRHHHNIRILYIVISYIVRYLTSSHMDLCKWSRGKLSARPAAGRQSEPEHETCLAILSESRASVRGGDGKIGKKGKKRENVKM